MKKLIKKIFKRSKLIRKNKIFNLYKTKDGFFFWLNPEKYLDKEIIDYGEFEPDSTALIKKLIKPGDVVLDIGANIGYYSVLFSTLAGGKGRVLCFEPTKHYRDVLLKNIQANNINNVEVLDYGLSNNFDQIEIAIGDCSATLHWAYATPPKTKEIITIKRLDDVFKDMKIEKLNFIKIDIDGHEPHCLEGAWATIEKYKPLILLEVNHENYLEGGITAWDFYQTLKKKNFYIYSEKTLNEYKNRMEFLRECGNFAYSGNALISLSDISNKIKG